VVAAILIAYRFGRAALKFRHEPMLYFMLCMIIYYVVMSGVVYNLIRDPPLYDINHQTGAKIFIMPNARAQYVFEGFIVAAILSVTGITFLGFGGAVPKTTDSFRQRVAFVLVIVAFLFCVRVLDSIYAMKYYRSAFEVPRTLLKALKLGK